jgi:RecA/RadA recombinase
MTAKDPRRKKKDTPEDKKVRLQILDQVSSGINSKYKSPAVYRADQQKNAYHQRRPFGIMNLDLQIGGGLPAGGACAISGEDQAGKTELLYYLIAMNQRIYGDKSKIALAYVEGGFDIDRCKKVGVQIAYPKEMVEYKNHIRTECGRPPLTEEEKGQTVGVLNLFGGDTGEAILTNALEFVHSNEYQLVLIDSLTALLPQANVDKDLSEDEKRAAWASMMTRFCNFVSNEFKPTPNEPNFSTLVGVQQMRANQEKANAPSHIQKYLPSAKPKESRSYQHLALVHLIISEGEKEYRTLKGVKTVIGKELKWFVDKGKAGCCNHRRGDTTFYFDGFGHVSGVDRYGSVITSGIQYGVLAEGEGGIYLKWPRAELLASSIPELEDKMANSVELELQLRHYILWRNGIEGAYSW